MKKLLLFYCSIVLLFYCFASPVLAAGAGQVLKFEVEEGKEIDKAPEVIVLEEKPVEYPLPWPGILPDHPLYWLKMIRDRIWGMLIRQPLRKAKWALLMADKRIWAAQMLWEKNKIDLSISTATKAEKYLERSVDQAWQAEQRGQGEKAFFEKMVRATRKHEQILKQIRKKTPPQQQAVMKKTLEYPQKSREKILMLLEEQR